MRIGAEGIVVNEMGEVLLILRDDSRTWAAPGGSLEAGELPTVGVAREVAEETGIQVRPVRLVGLYHRPDDYLILSFRCLATGGQLTPSDESPQVGFHRANDLPKPIFALHRERLQRGLAHDGGRPHWGQQRLPSSVVAMRAAVYAVKNVRRLLRGGGWYQSPAAWQVAANVVIHNQEGAILWVKRTDHDLWNLPGGGCERREAPWQAAMREAREETGLHVQLTGLSGVYVKPAKQEMIFVFTAGVIGGRLTTGPESAAFAYFRPGEEPANSLPKQVERAVDASRPVKDPLFRVQENTVQ
ncbi:MAG: NUDIX domain-containing protein [Chloroflexota bacterium]